MPKYLVTWTSNPTVWPTDPQQKLAVLEGATAGGDQMLKAGIVKEMGWFTDQTGFAIFEVPSTEQVIAMVAPFWPYYNTEIREIVPWATGTPALVASARQAAGR
jgi:hypothetical protein